MRARCGHICITPPTRRQRSFGGGGAQNSAECGCYVMPTHEWRHEWPPSQTARARIRLHLNVHRLGPTPTRRLNNGRIPSEELHQLALGGDSGCGGSLCWSFLMRMIVRPMRPPFSASVVRASALTSSPPRPLTTTPSCSSRLARVLACWLFRGCCGRFFELLLPEGAERGWSAM